MRRLLIVFAVAATLLAGARRVSAAECRGVSFPAHQTLAGTKLELNGVGVREATVFGVDVYVAALYVANSFEEGPELAAAEMKKRLILRLVRDVSREKIATKFEKAIERNNPSTHGEFDSKIERLNGWMQDAESGQRVVFDYVPERGLAIEFAGEEKGTIAGGDFAEAFFRMWLGPKPPNPGLKTGLLGGGCN